MDYLFTSKEISEILRVSVMTVYRLVKDGKLPSVRIAGQKIRIRANDVHKSFNLCPAEVYIFSREVAEQNQLNSGVFNVLLLGDVDEDGYFSDDIMKIEFVNKSENGTAVPKEIIKTFNPISDSCTTPSFMWLEETKQKTCECGEVGYVVHIRGDGNPKKAILCRRHGVMPTL